MTDQGRGVPSFDAAKLGKELLRATRAGALATLDEPGFPFASLVTVATDHDGSPLLLLSRLAAHTRNLERDPRASILLAQAGRGDPLAHPRLTVIGRAEPAPAARIRARFLARHPKAELYADFADFAFWRLAVEGAHLNGGFARAATLTAQDLLTDLDGAQQLLDAEEERRRDLNRHKDLCGRCAAAVGAAPGPWTFTGLDPEGVDLAAGDRTARLPFGERVLTPAALRTALSAAVDEAVGRLPAGGEGT